MTAKNRAGLITKLQTSLKKHYKPAPAAPGRPLMEHFLYAALLEDAPVDIADEGFAKCEQEFFDWNEVRVTSVTELAEVLSHFPAPAMTALRLKRCLQSVFESFYSFEIDHLKKENLGKAVAKFESMNGVTPFVLSYLIQHGLGGHAIPVNTSGIWIMFKTGIVSESEAKTGKVPGLERAIPKSKAIEFSSMLHQAAIALAADAKSKQVWEIIWAVNKDAEMTAPETASTKSAKRKASPPPVEAPSDDKAKVKSIDKAVVSGKPIAPESESKDKPTKPAPGKSASKAKPAADAVKATEATVKSAQPADAAKVTPASKSKSKSAATENTPASDTKKAKSTKGPAESNSAAESKKAPESKKPTESKKSAEAKKSSEASKPSETKETSDKSTAAAKSVKASSQSSKESAKDAPSTPAKKTTSTKAPSPAAEKTAPSESKPVKETSKKSEVKKPKEEVPPSGAGNQKLTKRKPR